MVKSLQHGLYACSKKRKELTPYDLGQLRGLVAGIYFREY
jgi:hypothetical protein